MDIPGIASFSGQPTLTSPPNTETQLAGRQTNAQQTSLANETALMEEQSPVSQVTSAVVNQASAAENSGFNPDNPASTIDLTV